MKDDPLVLLQKLKMDAEYAFASLPPNLHYDLHFDCDVILEKIDELITGVEGSEDE